MSISSSNEFSINANPDKAIMNFLDKYLYNNIFDSYELCNSVKLRIHDIDLLVHKPTRDIYVNAKTQISPFCSDSFAFEIIFTNKFGTINDGWFIKDDLFTDEYLLIWINKANFNEPVDSSIQELEVAFLDKNKIRMWVDLRATVDELRKKAIQMRKRNIRQFQIQGDAALVYTASLKEAPVHLVINKPIIDRLAHARFIVTPDGCQKRG